MADEEWTELSLEQPTRDEYAKIVATLLREGLRRCKCLRCGASLEGWSRDPDAGGGPKTGWVCVQCGGEVGRAYE